MAHGHVLYRGGRGGGRHCGRAQRAHPGRRQRAEAEQGVGRHVPQLHNRGRRGPGRGVRGVFPAAGRLRSRPRMAARERLHDHHVRRRDRLYQRPQAPASEGRHHLHRRRHRGRLQKRLAAAARIPREGGLQPHRRKHRLRLGAGARRRHARGPERALLRLGGAHGDGAQRRDQPLQPHLRPAPLQQRRPHGREHEGGGDGRGVRRRGEGGL